MKKSFIFSIGFLFALYSCSQVVINEVDADNLSTDTAEFIELFGASNLPLDGYVLVFYNGNGDDSYAAFDLDGRSLNADGFFVLCGNSANVLNCDWDVTPDSSLLQNGADAVALYQANAADFPSGTALTSTNLIDAIVYDTSDPDDVELINGLTPGKPQINENGNGNKDIESNSRIPDGGLAFDTTLYTQKTPTPGVTNFGGPISDVVINEFVANHTGTDLYEYLELFGDPSTDYATYWIIQIEGDIDENPGLLDSAYQVGTTNAQGFWWTGFLNNELGGGTKTFMLVDSFLGTIGADLDSDDNGVLDSTPWTSILDDVGTNDGDAGDLNYGLVALGDGFDGNSFSPGGASRIPNGVDTNSNLDWVRNNFNGLGLPGFSGSLGPGEAVNTPGFENTVLSPPRINEFVMDHTGTDDHEFIEIFGDVQSDYSDFWILVVSPTGVVLDASQVGTMNNSHTFTESYTNTLPNGTVTLLLVHQFTGAVSDDLDTNNDGVLDSQPWTVLVDDVALNDGNSGDQVYSTIVLTAGFDGDPVFPGGASRIPHGHDTNAVSDWMRNDFDGEGISGLPGSLVAGEALNTPNNHNSQYLPGANDLVLNEWVANHTGSDDHEYVEIFGSANTNYTHLWILGIEGDLESNPGTIDLMVQIGETQSEGYWYSGFLTDQIENGSMTFLLVEGFSGLPLDDLDTNNDGTLDVTPWITLIDEVAVNDDDLTDLTYSSIVLNSAFDGGVFTPGGASRIPNGIDTDQISDWKRNDYHGRGLPDFSGSLEPGEALNTPGTENKDSGTDARLTEFVAHHDGGDTYEFVEIHGDSGTSYHTTYILILDGDTSDNPGQVLQVILCGITNGGGFWASDFSVATIENGSQTYLVVEDFSGSVLDDLDTDDNGILDNEPWSILQDSLSVLDGDAGDLSYSNVVLLAVSAPGGILGGASRFPYGLDTDAPTDWVINDFDGAGLPGFVGSIETQEAYHTPARVSRIFLDDYYQLVNSFTPLALRMSLHEIIRDHIRFDYTSLATDTWDILEEADEDPLNSANVLTIYRNRPYLKEGGGNDFYNREHTWPKSYGFPIDAQDSSPYTDCHHLMIADSGYNSSRSNLPYGECSASCTELLTDDYNGQGGGSGAYPGNTNWRSGDGNTGTFEVWNERRGDAARALLYMDIRYEGDPHSFTGFSEPDLILTDDIGIISTVSTNAPGIAYMGRLSILLQWHEEDPVDDMERLRNEVIHSYQGNRNPFIDHPEWVDCVFNGTCTAPCYISLLPDWNDFESTCNPGAVSVLDYIGVIEGSCPCWP